MNGTVRLVVEILRVVQHQVETHVDREVLAIEVVVPEATFGNHEEAEELVGEDHLDLLVEVLSGVVGLVGLHLRLLVLFTPFKSGSCELVDTQTARACSKAARGDN